MITYKQLLYYVLEFRRGKAFEGWTTAEIMSSFIQGVDDNSLLYSVSSEGEINGVVVGLRSDETKIIHVDAVVTSSKGVLKKFIETFFTMYPDYELRALRRGKTKIYNKTFLLNRISKGQ